MTSLYTDIAKELTHLPDGSDLKELLTYNGICYWWFMDRWIYDDLNNDLIHNTPLRLKKLHSIFTMYLPHISYLLDYIVHKYSMSLTTKQESNQNPNKYHVLLHSLMYQWRNENANSNALINLYYDNIYKNIPKNISSEMVISDVLNSYSFFINRRKIKKIKKSSEICVDVLFKYWSINCSKVRVNAQKYFNRVWKKVSAMDEWFQNLSEYTKLDVNILKNQIKYYLLYNLPEWAYYNYIVDKMIRQKMPSILLISQEQVFPGRGWLYAGNKYHIPTIGIQHGVLPIMHSGYNYHNPDDMLRDDNSNYLTAFPIPTNTTVWGKHDYDVLVKKGYYPENRVTITGNQRYDALVFADKKYSRDRFCKLNNIDTSHKIILWATQSHDNSDFENISYFNEIFSFCSKHKEIVLIIKQHPGEHEKERQLIQKYIDDYKSVKVLMPDKDADTTELIYISDVVILKNSTVGQEAIALQKPIVVLDFSSIPDSVYYVKEGVAYGVFSKNNLDSVLSNVLFANKCDEMFNNQKKYIMNYLYRIDGKSGERCINLILQYLN